MFMLAGRLELCRSAHSHSYMQPCTWKGRNFGGTALCFPLSTDAVFDNESHMEAFFFYLSQPVYYSRTFSCLLTQKKHVSQSHGSNLMYSDTWAWRWRLARVQSPHQKVGEKKKGDSTRKRLGCCSEFFSRTACRSTGILTTSQPSPGFAENSSGRTIAPR